MRLNPHLIFDGRCEEAFRSYAASLGGRIHATLDLGEGRLTGADVSIEEGYRPPEGVSVLLEPASTTDAERVFARLSEGGTVRMSLQRTFWAERFGMVTDRFGIPWMLNCATP
jgi:PhnB protein